MKRVLIAVLVLALTSLGGYGASRETDEIGDEKLLQLNPKMARFLVKHVKADQPRRLRLNALLDSIFSKNGLGIKYGDNETKTAIETFESRSGNCLSFTVLFVSMARHLGLNAYFMEVSEVTSRDLVGEVVVANHHMFAEVQIDNGVATVDFLPGTEKQYNLIRRISDERAVAHYYNNLGAERLAAGEPQLARAYFKKAVETDPELVPGWTNLGVVLRRLRQFDEAERSYLQALTVEKDDPTALSNLAGLYLSEGRTNEAAPLLVRVNEHLQKNPYHHLRLGQSALSSGDLGLALSHLKEAVRRSPRDARLHAALAEAHLRAGDEKEALSETRKALIYTHDQEQRARFQQQLDSLTAQ